MNSKHAGQGYLYPTTVTAIFSLPVTLPLSLPVRVPALRIHHSQFLALSLESSIVPSAWLTLSIPAEHLTTQPLFLLGHRAVGFARNYRLPEEEEF